MDNLLAVNEIYKELTVQGEGPSIGRPFWFLRLGGCNLKCGFCDTPYTWDWTRFDPKVELHQMAIDQVAQQLLTQDAALKTPARALVITGGEPMLQQRAVYTLSQMLDPWWVEIETAGTLAPFRTLADQYNVSLKLETSGNPLAKRRKPKAITALRDSGRAVWKFVVTTPDDFNEIDELVKGYDLAPVYIMPEGVDVLTLRARAKLILPLVLDHGYYFTPRLQIELFGNQRGT